MDCLVGYFLKLCSVVVSCQNTVDMIWVAAVIRKSFTAIYQFPDRLEAVLNHPYRVRHHLYELHVEIARSKRYQAERAAAMDNSALQRESAVRRISSVLGSLAAAGEDRPRPPGSGEGGAESPVPWTEARDSSLAEAVQAHEEYCCSEE
jgi:hypothetical protein